MRTYAAAKTVHQHMRRQLAPWFVDHGWKKKPGYACAFVRDDQVLWVQPSSFGSSLGGSLFTLNLSLSDQGELSADERVLMRLDAEDRQIAQGIEATIATRIPIPEATHPIYEWMALPGHEGEMHRKSFDATYRVNPEAWEDGRDIWLRYFDSDDLDLWVGFLLARMHKLI